ncbi:MAG: DUF362 domain-containing protein [Candidatus Berkelbacteria bacterium]|nr:DUF362 domain-containing protein [Candidatus Berkelbacteria bacterium]
MIKISYIKSDDRRHNIERSLALIKTEITKGLKEAKRVVIKPNCSRLNSALAVTHTDTLDAVLNFITPFVKHQIIVAEGTLNNDTLETMKSYGYLKLQSRYDFAIVDLNQDDKETIELLDADGRPAQFHIAKTLLDSDYIISVSPPKTDNIFVFSGAIKNATIGSLVKPTDLFSGLSASKLGKMFSLPQNFALPINIPSPFWHKNIETLYNKLNIGLAVIDGFESMQGNGPHHGDSVASHFAVAGTNPVAADGVACNCLDINMSDIGYLSLLPLDKDNVFIVGDDWIKNIITIKKPSNFENIRHKN